MSLAAPRTALRHTRLALRRTNNGAQQRRYVSTEDAMKTAQEARSKAMEGLSRVTSSASAVASRMGSAMGNVNVVQRSGFLGPLISNATYYSKVGLELGKLIFHGRGMSPPSIQTFQSYFQPVVNMARNPQQAITTVSSMSQAQPANMLAQVRSLDSATLTTYGVIAAEVIGFFSVGEIIGRMKIVGYRSTQSGHH